MKDMGLLGFVSVLVFSFSPNELHASSGSSQILLFLIFFFFPLIQLLLTGSAIRSDKIGCVLSSMSYSALYIVDLFLPIDLTNYQLSVKSCDLKGEDYSC